MSLERCEQGPDKCPPSSLGFSLGLISMCPVRGQASEAASFPSSLEGCILCCLLLPDGENSRQRGNLCGRQPSPVPHHGLHRPMCPSAQGPIHRRLCELWAHRLQHGIPCQLLMVDDRAQDSASMEVLEVCIQMAGGSGVSPRSVPFHWNRSI